MNWDEVQGNWKQLKGKAQQQWGKLTDDDMNQIQGRRTEMVGRLQERYGHSKEQAERELDRWSSSLDEQGMRGGMSGSDRGTAGTTGRDMTGVGNETGSARGEMNRGEMGSGRDDIGSRDRMSGVQSSGDVGGMQGNRPDPGEKQSLGQKRNI